MSGDATRTPLAVSLFSGIGGLDHGLAAAGFRHLLLCESDPWRRSVLRARFPGVPIADDVRLVCRDGRGLVDRGAAPSASSGGRRTEQPSLVCGGSPCQDLSVAGQRRGLSGGDRSSLFFEMARVIDAFRPRWFLFENVPGLFSSNGGRDFGTVLGTLADLGYGVAWRVLDSRYFGVPQRRRRVFIVGALADDDPRAAAERAGQVLGVGSRCGRHPATRGEARADVAGTLDGGAGERGWSQDVERMTFIAETVRSHPRPGSNSSGNLVAAPLTAGGHPNRNMPGRRKEDDENLVATSVTLASDPISARELAQPSTKRNGDPGVVQYGASVRRLTPTECERLQALPDGHTCSCGGHSDYRTAVRLVWIADRAENQIGRPAGAAVGLFEQTVLRYGVLHDLARSSARENRGRWPEARTAGFEGTGLRSLRDFQWSDRQTSPRPQSSEQRARELAAALCVMPYARALGDGFASRAREAAADLESRPGDWPHQLGGGVKHFCVCPDSRRYAGLGDAVTASVGEWIGHRIIASQRRSAEDVSPLKEMRSFVA